MPKRLPPTPPFTTVSPTTTLPPLSSSFSLPSFTYLVDGHIKVLFHPKEAVDTMAITTRDRAALKDQLRTRPVQSQLSSSIPHHHHHHHHHHPYTKEHHIVPHHHPHQHRERKQGGGEREGSRASAFITLSITTTTYTLLPVQGTILAATTTITCPPSFCHDSHSHEEGEELYVGSWQ